MGCTSGKPEAQNKPLPNKTSDIRGTNTSADKKKPSNIQNVTNSKISQSEAAKKTQQMRKALDQGSPQPPVIQVFKMPLIEAI